MTFCLITVDALLIPSAPTVAMVLLLDVRFNVRSTVGINVRKTKMMIGIRLEDIFELLIDLKENEKSIIPEFIRGKLG